MRIEFHSQNIYFLIKRFFYDFPSVEVYICRGVAEMFLPLVIAAATLFRGGQKENFSTPHTCCAEREKLPKRCFRKPEIHPFFVRG